MNWSYAMIPSPSGDGFVRLNREPERKFHVENPKKPHNEIIKEQSDIGNYSIMSNFIIPPDDKIRDLYGDYIDSLHAGAIRSARDNPEHARLLWDYVKEQEKTCRIMDGVVASSVWLLQKT